MKHIVIIGGGPAGYPAALKAASLGAKVTLVEKHKLGGVCLNCGCIPSKSLLDASHRFEIVKKIPALCAEGATEASSALFSLRDWNKIKARRQAVTQKLAQGISFLLKKANVEVIQGTASFESENEIKIITEQGEVKLTCDGVILATGSQAFFPPPFDAIRDKIYNNANIFDMPSLPERLIIVGGGVIGCEFADLMSALGVEVSVVEMQPRILPTEEEGAARVLSQALSKRGVKIFAGVSAVAAEEKEGIFKITLSDGKILEAQAVLAAIGRSVDLTELSLEKVGISWTRKGVQVNPETLQLKNNIYAAGDVNGLFLLAHAATRQGEVAACNLCGKAAIYHNDRVPKAIYTTPEVAAVGLSKREAAEKGYTVKTHKIFMLANGRALTQEASDGFFEIYSDEPTGLLLGACFVGINASELIHIISVALTAKMTTEQLREVIFAHPTVAEAIGEALGR